MIPSLAEMVALLSEVYQRGLVIDSQLSGTAPRVGISVSKGIGD